MLELSWTLLLHSLALYLTELPKVAECKIIREPGWLHANFLDNNLQNAIAPFNII